ncbi:MAG: hypothetical protein GY940_42755 [bacterium]|nr:hypothetical protein [bacterium]
MTKGIVLTFLLIPFLFSFTSPVNAQQNQDAAHDKQIHNISITVQLLPVYATDKDGNPVFDLKQKDIQLFVDGKPMEILHFNRFKTETNQAPHSPDKPKTVKAVATTPERINFLIFDSIISDVETEQSNEISAHLAREMIRNAPPGDGFVIFKSDEHWGFRYIIGPTKNKMHLFRVLEMISKGEPFKKPYEEMVDQLMVSEVSNFNVQAPDPPEPKFNKARVHFEYHMNMIRTSTGTRSHNNGLNELINALTQFQHILKSIDLNKAVYLISPSRPSWIEQSKFYALEDTAKAINYGGGMFYIINPIPEVSRQRRSTLKFMSDFVKGGFIAGSSIKALVSQVKNSTSAYYELAFRHRTAPGQKLKIKLKSNRKGIKLATLAYTKQDVPYKKMTKRQQQVFLLNVIHGGAWSRKIADVKRTKYKFMGSGRAPMLQVASTRMHRKPPKAITIRIPREMRKKKVHIYKVAVDKKTLKADINMVKKKPGNRLWMYFNTSSKWTNYFVIIEPSKPMVIYNKLK